jgi:molybdopterin converting factor subunit 1
MNTPDDFRKWNDRLRNTLRLRLFAVAREKAGQAEIDLELPMPSTVGDLRLELAMQYPQLAGLAPRVMVAVDAEYASDETMIGPGAKVAIIPPVSGGSEAIGSTKHEAGA